MHKRAYHLHLVSDKLLICIVAGVVFVATVSLVSVGLAASETELVAKFHIVQPATSDDVLDFVIEETVEHGHVDTLVQSDER